MSDRAAQEKKMKEDRKVREMTKTVETVVSGDDAFKVDEQWKPWWTAFKFVSYLVDPSADGRTIMRA